MRPDHPLDGGAARLRSPAPTPAYASIIPPDQTSPLVIGWSLGTDLRPTMDGWPYGVTL